MEKEEKEKKHVPEHHEKIGQELIEKENRFVENKKKNDFVEKMRGNPWLVSTIALGAVVLLLIFFNFSGGGITGKVSENEIGQNLLDFYESAGAEGLELESVKEVSGVYQVNFKYQGVVVPIYATQDGKLAGSLAPLSITETNDEQQEEEPQDVPKSNKPKVELFVMTHCPYGTQAEKGIIPALKALGNTIDGNVRFVHYFIHGDQEEDETYRQVCIREEQSAKYLDYLKCFLEDGNSERCLTQTGIDKNKLNSCIENNAKNYYAKDAELSEGYGVRGSPTLVINGVMVNSARDSASYLETICSAFNTVPSKCSTELSSQTPGTGFGSGTASSGSASAQC